MAATYFILKAGIAPPELKNYPPAVRLMFWGWVVDLGLKRKDRELSQGLNAKGRPLPGVAPATRKHRKSAMTPTGKGDPSAPYLMPGRGLSRTRSLLVGKAHPDYAEFGWRYDPWTGDQWGKILAYHAQRGSAYDVVGLSPAGQAWVAREAGAMWRKWLSAGNVATPMVRPAATAAARIPLVGRTNLEHAVGGIGGTLADVKQAIREGRSTGFMTQAEWTKHFRQPVANGRSNVILQHIGNRGVLSPSRQLETAIANLIAGLDAGLSVAQLESLLGSMFEKALAEAVRRGVVAIGKAGNRTVLKVVR